MFTRKPDRDGAPVEPSRPALAAVKPNGSPPPQTASTRPGPSTMASASASVIGADLSIVGNLESKGEIQIEGEVQGDIHAARIVVGEHAKIIGSLLAQDVIVRGNVAGSVRGNNVTLQSASRVEGDVFHRSLAIEEGAYFEGKSRRSQDPLSVQRTADGMPPPG
jgi:cytoskeletal protein CcmA (bactofilin family)